MKFKKLFAIPTLMLVCGVLLIGCNLPEDNLFDEDEYEAYNSVMEILEQSARNYLESNTTHKFVRISEFHCNFIHPEGAHIINPPKVAPHSLSYVIIIEENGKIGRMSFSFTITRYVNNFVDLINEINKGVDLTQSGSVIETPRFIENKDFYNTIAPLISADVAPYVEHSPYLSIFSTNEKPIIIHSLTHDGYMYGNGEVYGNGDVTGFSMMLHFPKSKMTFHYGGYYVPQGVHYNKSKVFDLSWARRVSELTEIHIKFLLSI